MCVCTECDSDRFFQGCIKLYNRIKLLGKKIKLGRREEGREEGRKEI